jgi:hypothetical protein
MLPVGLDRVQSFARKTNIIQHPTQSPDRVLDDFLAGHLERLISAEQPQPASACQRSPSIVNQRLQPTLRHGQVIENHHVE